MLGASKFQIIENAAEPYLVFQTLSPIPIGVLVGVILAALTLLLRENRKMPAALAIALIGLATGLLLGTHEGLDKLRIGFNTPKLLPGGIPSIADFAGGL